MRVLGEKEAFWAAFGSFWSDRGSLGVEMLPAETGFKAGIARLRREVWNMSGGWAGLRLASLKYRSTTVATY